MILDVYGTRSRVNQVNWAGFVDQFSDRDVIMSEFYRVNGHLQVPAKLDRSVGRFASVTCTVAWR